VSEHIVPIAQK